MLKIERIRMNHLECPVGTLGMPGFSWVIESDRKNVVQEAYQLQIAIDCSFEKIIYDSGWVKERESAHVIVDEESGSFYGKPESCTRYYVRVRVRDGQEESSYSEIVSFVTAILDQGEWKARFISAETEEDKDNSKGTCLRKRVCVGGEIKSAFVCVTALGLYQLYINGKKVGDDELTPGWTSYRKHLCYQTYDVTHMLQVGENTLGAMLGAGWYKGKMGVLCLRNNYGTRTALLMQMVVCYEDGRKESFVTDESWEGADGPVSFSEIYDGECFDGGFKIDHWRKVSRIDFPMESLTPQAGCRVGIMERLPAKEIFQTPKGETVIDFGQNLTGWVHFRVNASKGEQVVFKCFESLDAQGNVYTDNLRTAKQEIHYLCRGDGDEEYHPFFTFMGFRYIHVLAYPGEMKKENFMALAVHSKLEQTGSFSCSAPLVNGLQHNILWGLKGNFLDIPTDCPQRDERMGWTGDAQIFSRTACYLMGAYTFFEKWMQDVAADQTEEGGVPHIVPDIVSGKAENDWLLSQGTHSAAAWADAAVIIPWTMYLVYGDRGILEKQYESMKKWIDFMQSHAKDNIWNYQLQFGDWVALDAKEGSYFGATPNDLTCTAYYAYSTGLFAKIANVLGRQEDAEKYEELWKRIVDKFQRTFFTEQGEMTVRTQTAHIVALYFNLVPEKYRVQTAKRLVELLRKENDHLVTGFVGTPYFCHALSQNGYVEEAYKLLLQEDFPSWLYQVKMGATTVWEHWDGLKPDGTMWSPDMNSFNHYAYGAVGDWLYRVVLGMEIDEKEPGYRHSIICPQTGTAFEYAEGTFESVYGMLRVRWEKADGGKKRKLWVRIPHNTTSQICLEYGAEPERTDGLEFTKTDGVWKAACGSGCWEITYRVER